MTEASDNVNQAAIHVAAAMQDVDDKALYMLLEVAMDALKTVGRRLPVEEGL